MDELVAFVGEEIERELWTFPSGNGPFAPGVLAAMQAAADRRELVSVLKQMPAADAEPHLKLLVARYTDRPGYRPEWAPVA